MDRSHAYALDRLNRTRTARRERAARRRRNPRLGCPRRGVSPCVASRHHSLLCYLPHGGGTLGPLGSDVRCLAILRVSRGTQFRTSVPKETLQGPACDSSGETGEQNRHIGKGSDSGRKGYLLYERSRGDRSTGEVIYWSSTQHSQC